MNQGNLNLNSSKIPNQNDLALVDFLRKQLDEKKDIIFKLTNEFTSLETQVKLNEESELKLNKRIRDLTDKVNQLGIH